MPTLQQHKEQRLTPIDLQVMQIMEVKVQLRPRGVDPPWEERQPWMLRLQPLKVGSRCSWLYQHRVQLETTSSQFCTLKKKLTSPARGKSSRALGRVLQLLCLCSWRAERCQHKLARPCAKALDNQGVRAKGGEAHGSLPLPHAGPIYQTDSLHHATKFDKEAHKLEGNKRRQIFDHQRVA